MSIRLGMKSSDGTMFYKNGNEVKHWANARSVEIRLLLTGYQTITARMEANNRIT